MFSFITFEVQFIVISHLKIFEELQTNILVCLFHEVIGNGLVGLITDLEAY